MSANLPWLRGARLVGTLGLLGACANLIGLDDYEETNGPVRPSGGRPSEGGESGGEAEGAAPDSEAGQGGDSSPASGGKAAGGRTNTPMGGEAGDDSPAQTGGRRAAGGQRGLGGTASGGSANGGEPSGGSSEGGGGSPASGGVASGGTPATGGATGGTPATGGNPGTGGQGPTSCGLPGFTAACEDCIDQSCDAYCDPCLADSDCASLTSCIKECDSEDCVGDCFDSHPESAGEMLAEVYVSCAQTTCEASCGKAFGADCDDDSECTSDYCSGPGGFCSYLCTEHEECPGNSWCADDVDGFSKCLVMCADEFDCPSAHVCGYVSTFDDFAFMMCTSALPLSAPCDFDSECHSGYCTANSGFCYNSCVDEGSCADDASCVPDPFYDDYGCFLDCTDDLDCEPYPETSSCSLVEGLDVCQP
jgi:hypothetical protein